jgi:hypothetical protein
VATHLGRVALALGLWFGTAAARPLRASNLTVTSTPFGCDTLTLGCELRLERGRLLPADSGSVGRPSYRFHVSEDVTGHTWESGWLPVPSAGPDQKVRVSSTIAMLADSTSARQVRGITITLFVDEGSQARRAIRRHYHRWSDGRFRPLPEQHGAWLGQMGRTMEPIAPEPEATPRVIIIQLANSGSAEPEARKMSWGALKVKYRP